MNSQGWCVFGTIVKLHSERGSALYRLCCSLMTAECWSCILKGCKTLRRLLKKHRELWFKQGSMFNIYFFQNRICAKLKYRHRQVASCALESQLSSASKPAWIDEYELEWDKKENLQLVSVGCHLSFLLVHWLLLIKLNFDRWLLGKILPSTTPNTKVLWKDTTING